MKRAWGGLVFLAGVGLGCWVAYKGAFGTVLVPRGPMSILMPFLFSFGMLFVGLKWMRE